MMVLILATVLTHGNRRYSDRSVLEKSRKEGRNKVHLNKILKNRGIMTIRLLSLNF